MMSDLVVMGDSGGIYAWVLLAVVLFGVFVAYKQR